ncbi:hypothetical protein CBER1_09468 [Cercospora berteroae]|uniref:Uncharacterized protein n=1 Tax=Cercospora berteroae TaxID=357750 RepID=A0A2S6CNU1_9PEZI|nr:hypothetical protein CBER1_09468 [Cercospora berteroae]
MLRDTISVVPSECKLRIIIAEDLSRDVIEALGVPLNLDPRFFRQHIDDYLFYESEVPWVTHPNLFSEAKKQSCMNFAFLRARYYASDAEFQAAQRQSGTFNVLRRLDSDRSRSGMRSFHSLSEPASIGLARSKVTTWFEKANDMKPVIAVILCDPTVTPGKPLWKEIDIAQGELRPSNFVGQAQPVGEKSLCDHFTQAYGSLTLYEVRHISASTQMIAQPALNIMIKEWLLVIQYMTAQVGRMEWEFQRPSFAENSGDLALLASRAFPWRRTMKFYKNWVRDILDHISIIATKENHTGANLLVDSFSTNMAEPNGLQTVIPDLQCILRRLDEISELIERLSVMASSAGSLEEARRSREALQQNRSLGLLSFLATIFLPLNFATSFLSMSPNFSASQNTFWLFFAIGIPLTVIVVSLIRFLRPGRGL